jgi:hypothetical protein
VEDFVEHCLLLVLTPYILVPRLDCGFGVYAVSEDERYLRRNSPFHERCVVSWKPERCFVIQGTGILALALRDGIYLPCFV